MRGAVAATLAVVAGLVAANMLGVAAAEAPTTTTPVRTVSVEGVATVPIAQGASLAVATAAYREGMGAAMADALNKAEFLVGKAGGTLGPVQSIAEGGGSISCTGGDEESDYIEYTGASPDFGSNDSSVVSAPAAAPRTLLKRPKKPKKHTSSPTAKKASATTCTLSTQVSLVYAIN
jgi:hypothetical protein